MNNLNKNAIVKIICDCCGKEIECPEHMLKTSKKHVCYQCFQNPKNFNTFTDEERKNVHVDIPMEQIADTVADNFAATMVDEMFPEIWSKKKRRIQRIFKKRSRKRNVRCRYLSRNTNLHGFYERHGKNIKEQNETR